MKEVKMYVDDLEGHYRIRIFYGREGARALVGTLTLRKDEVGDFIDELHLLFDRIYTECSVKEVFQKGQISDEEYRKFEKNVFEAEEKEGK